MMRYLLDQTQSTASFSSHAVNDGICQGVFSTVWKNCYFHWISRRYHGNCHGVFSMAWQLPFSRHFTAKSVSTAMPGFHRHMVISTATWPKVIRRFSLWSNGYPTYAALRSATQRYAAHTDRYAALRTPHAKATQRDAALCSTTQPTCSATQRYAALRSATQHYAALRSATQHSAA